MFVLAEVPVVTDSVGLAPDIPTAATQASWLPSLGLVPFSLVTPVQLSLPMLTVHGWSTHTGLGHPLLTPPCHPSVMCGLVVSGDQGEQKEQQSCSVIKGHTLISPETEQNLQQKSCRYILVTAEMPRSAGCSDTADWLLHQRFQIHKDEFSKGWRRFFSLTVLVFVSLPQLPSS